MFGQPRSIRLFLCTLAAAIIGCTGNVFAQRDSLKRISEVKILTKRLPELSIIVPAQKLTSADFLQHNAVNVAEAIKNFTGVNIKDYGGIGGLKTVSVRGLGSNHTGVFVDGLPLSDAQNEQIDLGQISLNNVAEIQLVNAQPDALLLPARAYSFASAILIQPKVPVVTFVNPSVFHVGLRGGSFGLFEPSVQWEQRVNTRWTAGINTTFTTANGHYAYRINGNGTNDLYTRRNADVTTYRADGYLQYKRDSISSFNIRVSSNISQRGLPNAVVFYTDHSAQRLWEDDFSVQGKYQTVLYSRFSLLLSSKYGMKDTRYLDPNFLNIQGKLDQRYHQQEYYQSAAVAYRLSNNIGVSYSADAMINQLQTNLYQFAYPTRLSIWQVLAAQYGRDRFNVRANLLHTHVNEWVKNGLPARPYNILSPTLLVAVQPFEDPSLTLRGFYKDIFRAPTFNDLYYSRIGNVNVRPERAKQYDLGATIRRAFKGTLSFIQATADGYYNRVNDKIVAIPNKDVFSWSIVNIGKVDIRGVDVTLQTGLKLSADVLLSLTTNYTFQRVLDVTDPSSSFYLDQAPYVPVHAFGSNASVSYRQWQFSYNIVYSSHRYYLAENIPEFRLPAFSVSDASLSWSTARKKPIKAAIEINNIFNSQYAVIRSFPMPGVNFRLSLFATL